MEWLGRFDLPPIAPSARSRPSSWSPQSSSPRTWPLNHLDALLLAQTDASRPMTSHYTLEIDRAVDLDGWARALTELVLDYPELGSRVVVGPALTGRRPRRVVSSAPRAALLERLFHDPDGSHAAMERWVSSPIDPSRELPIRVRVSPGQVAEQAVTLSLHASVSDRVGALALFDRYTARAAGLVVRRRVSRPFDRYRVPNRPRLSEAWAELRRLQRPAAQLWDRVPHSSPVAIGGRQLALRVIGPSIWGPLGRLSRGLGVSRTTLLWHAATTLMTRQRLDDPTAPLRLLAGVDLRAALGVPNDALGNWQGLLGYESRPASGAGAGAGAERAEDLVELEAELRRAGRPDAALLTSRVVTGLSRWLPSPFSLMLAAIRIRPRQCWPLILRPRSLWCVSSMPCPPRLGLDFTRVGDRVFVAATSPASLVRRATLEDFVDELLTVLRSYAGREFARR